MNSTDQYLKLLSEMKRSFCLNPLNTPSLDEIQREIPDANRSCLLSSFYTCSSNTKINSLKLYQEGKIIPMELSSGLAVLLLDLQADDTFLDLCCAPGCKLVLAGLLIGKENHLDGKMISTKKDDSNDKVISNKKDHLIDKVISGKKGSCTGVDIVRHRLCIAKSMVVKYKVPNVRLFLTDARKFNVPPHHSIGYNNSHQIESYLGSFDDLYSSHIRPFYSSSVYRKSRGFLDSQHPKYSKVLVDVECTHDGSIKHICKNGHPLLSISTDQIKELTSMQLEILNHAFSITLPGGTLIYSTCSLMKEQNENIVDSFMQTHSHECKVVDGYTVIDNDNSFSLAQFQFTSPTTGNTYLKIDPKKDKMGGFFIAKIVKSM